MQLHAAQYENYTAGGALSIINAVYAFFFVQLKKGSGECFTFFARLEKWGG
ncbi:hypothetical protein D3C79_1052800 [compost metagenome]